MEVYSKRIKRAKIGQHSHSTFLDLPGFIIMNIVARLPIYSICACRCVSKLFLSLISETHFTQLCSEISPFTTIVFNIGPGFYLYECDNEVGKYYNCIVPNTHKKATLVDCCKGLLCLMTDFNYFGIYTSPEHIIHICNPILGQYVTLPIGRIKKDMKEVYGFGIGSKTTSDYKVLRIITPKNDQPAKPILNKYSKAEVFTLGKSVEWTSVGYVPYPYNDQFPGAALNGALHWIFDDQVAESGVLCAFDIEKEQVQEIQFPPQVGRCTNNMSVAVLGNFVCLLDNSDAARLNIWTVKENGKCWSLDHVLILPDQLCADHINQPVQVLKDAGTSMKCGQLYFSSYGPRYTQILYRTEDNYIYAWWSDLEDRAVYTSNFSSLHGVVRNLWISKVTA